MNTLFSTLTRASIVPCCALFGSALAGAQQIQYTLDPASQNANLGSSLVALGDLDGDGLADFGVSDPGYNAPNPAGGVFFGSGAVYLISGENGSIIRSLFGNPAANQRFGASLAAADINQDGTLDLIVGATGGDGSVWVTDGTSGSTLLHIPGPSVIHAQFGVSLATIDDLNGDGVTDLVVGASLPSPGRVFVRSGADGSNLLTMTGTQFASAFGSALATLPDLDGDGLSDIAISAPLFNPGSLAAAGRVSFHSSATGEVLATVDGAVPTARLGASLAAGGDLDGDGLGDLLVASGSIGTCVVVSSRSGAVLADHSIAGYPKAPVVAGGSVDLDEDGVPDWMIGTPEPGVGAVRILSGFDNSTLLDLQAAASNTGFGSSILFLPGVGLVVGENRYPAAGGATGGRVHVYALTRDRDGDGVPDGADLFPDSILDPTVIFGGTDSMVENRVNQDGASLADLLAALEPADGWTSHGHFVGVTSGEIRCLEKAGVVDPAERMLLQMAAANSEVGKSF